jgi:P27 family predicted phage terminase small subunit
MKGRKPKPTQLRLIQGNPGKRAINHTEPFALPSVPDPPAHLTELARLEWDRSAPLLRDAGLLSNLDRNQFANYCQAFGRLAEAEELLQKSGLIYRTSTGNLRQSPFLAIINKCMAQIATYAAEFGLTPSSRSRIRVCDSKPDDDFARYLDGRPERTLG